MAAEMNGLEFEIIGNTAKAHRSVDKMKKSLTGLSPAAKSSSKNMNLFRAAISKATLPVSKFAKKLGSLGPSFRRILFYRAIRSVIREIGDAFKYGVNNLYGWSQIADGRFASSMDRITTALNYFKNSIGAAVAPIINALAPAIDILVDKIVVLLNAINQLFAKLSGATYWTKANKVAKQYAENASAAGSAAKEALRYLAPFDELNVLPSQNNGGGGAGAAGTDYSGMFETREAFNQEIADFAQMVKDAWANGDWEDVGRFIGGKINDLIDNKIDWEGLGIKTGKLINALFGIQYWTLDEINFTNLGNKIAEYVNSAISNINWDIAGRLPVKKLTAIIDTIIGFLGGLDWGQIGRAISNFVKGALNEGKEWFQSKDWNQMGKNLYNSLVDMLKNIDWKGLVKSAFEFALSAADALDGFITGLFTSQLSGVLQSVLNDTVYNNFVAWWNGVLDKISESAPRLSEILGLENLKLDPIEIDAKANITGAKDNIPDKQKTISGMTSEFSHKHLSGNFDSTISGMTSEFSKRTVSSGYNSTISGMNSEFWYRGVGPNFNSTIYGMKAEISKFSIKNGANGVSAGGGLYLYVSALGGVFQNGRWSSIPQYASGGLPGHGSMFVAGEAGPELVGHIGGRTEVLNASQIASAIAAGVSSAQTYSAPDIDEEVLYNAFLRALNDADIGGDTYLDGEALYRSVRKHNDMNTRMTGVNAFA